MTEVLLTFPFREKDLQEFQEIKEAHFTYAKTPSMEDLQKAEIILGQPETDWIRRAPKLRLVQCSSAGVDPYMQEKEIFRDRVVLANLSGAFDTSISECVLAMVLSLYKHLPLYRDHQHEKVWVDEGWQESPVKKNLLILGAGNIGTAVARLFRVFDCHITGLRRTKREIPPEFDEMITMDGLTDALKKADIVVAALPGTPETEKLMDSEKFGLMKPSAIFVNVGRGSLVDQQALYEALMTGKISGAALDVTSPEPLPKEDPLWECKNLLLTPHVTGGSIGHLQATEEKLFAICKENVRRYIAGEPILNVVDLSTGYRQVQDRF